MRKIFIIFILFQSFIHAQYNNEITTEKNFEQSNLYFQSYYLNPYGILNFKQVTPGLINNPFLNLYINPADLPDPDTGSALAYLDFRGDRTEPKIIQNYVYPAYYSSYYYPSYSDPRLTSQARTEPEPIFTVAVLSYPLKDITDKLMVGATYQLIEKDEKYYTMPNWIFYPRYGLDAFNVKTSAESSIPVQERYAGKDEMSNEVHLFSIFAGYKFSGELSAGVSLNGVIQNREGGYLNLNNSEYGGTSNYNFSNSTSQDKAEKYHHIDISAGINYFARQKLLLGIKGGILYGTANQNYGAGNRYFYKYNNSQTDPDWNINNSESATIQTWSHKGDTKYIGINFSGDRKSPRVFSGYYRFTHSDVNLNSTSSIFDTSFYSSRWVSTYDNTWSNYHSQSYTKDTRAGTGTRTFSTHELMVNYKWTLTRRTSVYVGIYFNSTNTQIYSSEPVNAYRYSSSFDTSSNRLYNSSYSSILSEDKRLEWNYNSKYWTMQIPVIFNFDLTDQLSIMLGLNRILNEWDITDRTIAYFNKRQRIDNGVSKTETNFAESYTQPDVKISEDFVKIFSSFTVKLSPAFKIRLLLDPDFENTFRFAQYWLGFEANI